MAPETDTHTEQAPEPLFSPDEAVAALWVKAYQGEVLGEAFFGAVAEQLDDEERAARVRVLMTLERRTKEATAPALVRAGLSTDPDPEMVSTAEVLAAAVASLEWEQFLGSIEPVTLQYLALYERIGELDPSERAAADLLVAHELALRNFARHELAGDTARSLDEINALAHMH
jgi:hypothetical protein